MHSVTFAIPAYKFILMLFEIIYFEVTVCSSAFATSSVGAGLPAKAVG
jgi:hypothetical protein